MMTLTKIRHAASAIAGIEYTGGRFPYGSTVKIERALADFLGCNFHTARKLLRGAVRPNPQMVKLLEMVKR